jgi:hypothetical protein
MLIKDRTLDNLSLLDKCEYYTLFNFENNIYALFASNRLIDDEQVVYIYKVEIINDDYTIIHITDKEFSRIKKYIYKVLENITK